jgi:spore coat polysaccharide biosynthesis protein SpsF
MVNSMKQGKIVAIIQARMGSTRLPGKILKLLAGKPVLQHVVERLSYCQYIDQIVVATTNLEQDNVVEQFCLDQSIACFRGSENDVLDRYYQAGKAFYAETVVRITADCPVIDPLIVDEIITRYVEGQYDVYGLGGSFPDGLDCTVFRFIALAQAWKLAVLPSEREHVGPYLEQNPDLFKLGSYQKFTNLGHHRWTLDEARDYTLLTRLFDKLYQSSQLFLTQDILNCLTEHPEYLGINSTIIRNEGYLKSLEKEKLHVEGRA